MLRSAHLVGLPIDRHAIVAVARFCNGADCLQQDHKLLPLQVAPPGVGRSRAACAHVRGFSCSVVIRPAFSAASSMRHRMPHRHSRNAGCHNQPVLFRGTAGYPRRLERSWISLAVAWHVGMKFAHHLLSAAQMAPPQPMPASAGYERTSHLFACDATAGAVVETLRIRYRY